MTRSRTAPSQRLVHGEADPVHGRDAAVGHAQILDHEQVVHHPSAPEGVTELAVNFHYMKSTLVSLLTVTLP
jgi:hypothetical protein